MGRKRFQGPQEARPSRHLFHQGARSVGRRGVPPPGRQVLQGLRRSQRLALGAAVIRLLRLQPRDSESPHQPPRSHTLPLRAGLSLSDILGVVCRHARTRDPLRIGAISGPLLLRSTSGCSRVGVVRYVTGPCSRWRSASPTQRRRRAVQSPALLPGAPPAVPAFTRDRGVRRIIRTLRRLVGRDLCCEPARIAEASYGRPLLSASPAGRREWRPLTASRPQRVGTCAFPCG